jgi:Domain of unknown function (DUF4292)
MNKSIVHFLSYSFILLSLAFSSCKTRKAAQKVTAEDINTLSNRSVDDLLEKLDSSAFKADWMNAKATVTTKEEDKENSFTIHLRARKDSAIWISVTPLLGIEAARVLITNDSIMVLDRINNKYRVGTMEYINKLLLMKVNFEIVQSLLIGNFFAYKKNENKFNSVYMEEKYYILSSLTKHKLKRSLEEKDPNKSVIQDCYVDANYRLSKISVEDQKINKTLVTDYSDFRLTDAGLFPFKSTTKITAEKNFEISIDYSRVEVGEKQEFPFNIPASFERVR